MGRLRPSLNKGGKDHFTPAGRKRPFLSPRVVRPSGEVDIKKEDEYPVFENMWNGPMMATVILMAFERALECGGYRAECFTEWFNKHLLEMQVELVQTIEGRLYHVMKQASGHTMGEREYFHWNHFLEHLRKYLYGK